MKPTILLVEDRKDIRDDLALQFHEKGAHVLTAASAAEAYEIFQRRASDVSALVTDIRLNEANDNDRAGVDLARRVSEISPSLPKIGVTAYDPQVGGGYLDEVYEKKTARSPRSIYRHVESIVARAVEFDDRRYDDVPQKLVDLRKKYRISPDDFSTLISSWRVTDLGKVALLAWHDVQELSSVDEEAGVIAPASYDRRELRIIAAGTEVSGGVGTRRDIATVIRRTADGVIAQLFGMPLVFTYGDDEKLATGALLRHLHDCYQEFGSPKDFVGSNLADVVRFHAFLASIFSEAHNEDD